MPGPLVLRSALAATLLLATVIGAACSGSQQSPALGRALNGRALQRCSPPAGEELCGTLAVPLDPTQTQGRTLEIAVAVIPARQRPAEDAVFFIAGGPGGSTIASWAAAARTFPGLDRKRDIVLVDQRGTGASQPLPIPPVHPGENVSDYAQRAFAPLGDDVRFFSTAAAMEDLDRVRAALGYQRVDLYGNSYGATALQYYLR